MKHYKESKLLLKQILCFHNYEKITDYSKDNFLYIETYKCKKCGKTAESIYVYIPTTIES